MNYYKDQLNQVNPTATEFAPTIKIFANGNGTNTNHLSLNEESAKELIMWLTANFISYKGVEETILNLNKYL